MIEVIIGDVMAGLAKIEDNSIDCVVTSPPYWGLRDYGVVGQLGMEPTLGEHIEAMVAVFAEVHRVLKKEGTLWLNYGDCYATAPNGRSAADVKALGKDDRTFRDKPFSTIGGVLKPKDLCMVPNRMAIALQEWGWFVRSEIIWAKPNPMPESVIDRPATAHEKIFLLTKSARYFYDAPGVRLDRTSDENANTFRGGSYVGNEPSACKETGNYRVPTGWNAGEGRHDTVQGRYVNSQKKQRGHGRRHAGFNERWDAMPRAEQQANGRNLRNYEPAPVQVWEIATAAFKDAHFATFPPELVERCLLAGCPVGGMVLDPFGGAGTTGLVADKLQRHAKMIELNPAYADMAIRRIQGDNPLFSTVCKNTIDLFGKQD